MARRGQGSRGQAARWRGSAAVLVLLAATIQLSLSRPPPDTGGMADIEAWEEALRERFHDEQPHAVDTALAARMALSHRVDWRFLAGGMRTMCCVVKVSVLFLCRLLLLT